jgi:hypothetical protein
MQLIHIQTLNLLCPFYKRFKVGVAFKGDKLEGKKNNFRITECGSIPKARATEL